MHKLLFVTQAPLVCVENVSLSPDCLPTYLVGLAHCSIFLQTFASLEKRMEVTSQ